MIIAKVKDFLNECDESELVSINFEGQEARVCPNTAQRLNRLIDQIKKTEEQKKLISEPMK